MLLRDRSCDILVKNVAAFCPCPKSLPEANVKSFGLIPLVEEVAKQPSILRSLALWLLVSTCYESVRTNKSRSIKKKY